MTLEILSFLTDYFSSSLSLTVPLAFAALGGLFAERSGVINIGLEGLLLTGAFVGAATSVFTQNLGIAILFAIFIGGCVGGLHAYLCISLNVNQIVSGLAINLAAAGLTAYGARLFFSTGTIALPTLTKIEIWGLRSIPILGVLFQQDILCYLLLVLIALSTYILFKTHWGLTVRAVGESAIAADATGISVIKVRYICVILSGILASLGGVYLALVHVGFFTEGMSAGKGFIAIAAIIFGRWHPVYTSLACFLFGATEALQLRIQAFNLDIPYQFLVMLPYLIALFALVGIAGKSTPPAALGKAFNSQHR